METLLRKFKSWEMTNENGLTLKESYDLLEYGETYAESIDYDVFQSIMDYRDHLEIEGE